MMIELKKGYPFQTSRDAQMPGSGTYMSTHRLTCEEPGCNETTVGDGVGNCCQKHTLESMLRSCVAYGYPLPPHYTL